MSKFQSPLLNFAETVLAEESGPKRANWDHRGTLVSGWEDRQGPTNILSAPVLE